MHFDMVVDITAIDHLETFDEFRFEVVYHLYSLPHKHRLRIKVRLDEDDVHVPSVSGVWKGALWTERETYDMFGILFDGHPDLRRLLLYPEFEGHPLRKDYGFADIQPLVPLTDIGVPMSLGTPFAGTNRERGIAVGEGTSAAGKALIPQTTAFKPDVVYK